MALWDKLRGELIDIIEWIDDTNDTLVWRFPRYDNEIKWQAKLVVREAQQAVFINEGKLADVFTPGTYTLDTQNLPILATLKGWKYGFHSPWKAEVYFISTRRFTDCKWGTKNPIMMRDPEFGPVRLRAFGTYIFRVIEPAVFIREIVGTDGQFTTAEITDQIRNMIVTRFSDLVAESKIPVLDLAANYDELGDFATKRLTPEFEKFGIEVSKLLVENISLPPAVEEAMDKRTSMGVVGNLQAYTQYQAATAMEKAADNEGMAGGAMGMGMGFAMANQMGRAVVPPGGAPDAANEPPPIPGGSSTYFVAVGGARTGPFGMQELAKQIANGQVTRESLVWKQGMTNWQAAGQLTDLAGLFDQSPPPVPPSAPKPPSSLT